MAELQDKDSFRIEINKQIKCDINEIYYNCYYYNWGKLLSCWVYTILEKANVIGSV